MEKTSEAQRELFRLQRTVWLVDRGFSQPQRLADFRADFVGKYLLRLPVRSASLLAKLACAYPGNPVSKREIINSLPEEAVVGKNPTEITNKIADTIFSLDNRLARETGLNIHYVRSPRGKKGFFMSGQNWLSSEETEKITLLGADYDDETFLARTEKSRTNVAQHLKKVIFPWLGTSGVLQSVVLLSEYDQLDANLIRQRVNIDSFSFLTDFQRQIMDSLIGNGGRSIKEMMEDLRHNSLYFSAEMSIVGQRVGTGRSANRNALALGYLLYKKEQSAQKSATRSALA